MKFIKASERMPGKHNGLVLKYKGKYYLGYGWNMPDKKEGKIGFSIFGLHYLHGYELENIEWLDEEYGLPLSPHPIDEVIDEVWDEFSRLVGTDIDDLQYIAGRPIITESDFRKAAKKIYESK